MISRLILNRDNNNAYKVLVITLFLLVTWIVVFTVGGTAHACTQVSYIPIILAAWYWYGRGGLVVGAIAGVLVGPASCVSLQDGYLPQSFEDWFVRLVSYCVIGTIIGTLFKRSQVQQEVITRSGTSLIETLAHTIELRDPYTNGHCSRVADMAVKIGERLRLSERQLLYLRWSALIHDIGKIAIPESILNKPGKLTDEEYAVIKQHPELGEWALQSTEYGQFVKDGVGSHHERWDGKGYPRGLSGTDIPLQARIIAVPDVWDAITSDRSYRPGLSYEESLRIMKEGRGTQFDPNVLDTFIELISEANREPVIQGVMSEENGHSRL